MGTYEHIRKSTHAREGGGREKKLHIFKFYLSKGEQKKKKISIYFHLPFAEKFPEFFLLCAHFRRQNEDFFA